MTVERKLLIKFAMYLLLKMFLNIVHFTICEKFFTQSTTFSFFLCCRAFFWCLLLKKQFSTTDLCHIADKPHWTLAISSASLCSQLWGLTQVNFLHTTWKKSDEGNFSARYFTQYYVHNNDTVTITCLYIYKEIPMYVV